MTETVAHFTPEGTGETIRINKLDASATDAFAYGQQFQEVMLQAWTDNFSPSRDPEIQAITRNNLKSVFDPDSEEMVAAQRRNIINAELNATTYFAAERTSSVPQRAVVVGLGKLVSYSAANPLKRLIGGNKYPYPYIHDVNVLPNFQSRGIGSTIMWLMLKDFEDEKQVATYTYTANHSVVHKLGQLGFSEREDDRQEVPNALGDGITRVMAHFEATVGNVKDELIAAHSFLAKIT